MNQQSIPDPSHCPASPAPLRRARRQRGQAVFEFTLMLPLFIAFILLTIDFGLWMYAHMSVANAAREGARFAAVRCAAATCGDGEAVKIRVTQRDGRIGVTKAEVTVGWIDRDGDSTLKKGDSYVVRVNHSHRLIFFSDFFSDRRIFHEAPEVTICSRADMRLEGDDTASSIVQDQVTC